MWFLCPRPRSVDSCCVARKLLGEPSLLHPSLTQMACQATRLPLTNLNCVAPAAPRGFLQLRIPLAQIAADAAAATQAMSRFQLDTDHWDMPHSHLWDIAPCLRCASSRKDGTLSADFCLPMPLHFASLIGIEQSHVHG